MHRGRDQEKGKERHIPEVDWIISPVVDGEVEVVRSDCADYIGSAGLDGLDSFFGCAVLEYDFELFLHMSILSTHKPIHNLENLPEVSLNIP